MKKRNKSISFDAMVKFFMQSYDIPTKKDIKKISLRLDRIETLITSLLDGEKSPSKTPFPKIKNSLTTTVLNIIKQFKNGVSILQIKAETGLDDKKLRNIIYRLNKNNQIKRKTRGIYIASEESPIIKNS
ncbi:MAG: hypothetical protein JRJ44_08610 [Deltaproteobacteria bacterium]|nr:hypothetical protein [Deltaproteobacteria bacterium]